MTAEFDSFRTFYPYYLDEHRHPVCRRLHFVGSCLVLITLLVMFATGIWWLAALAVFWGYGFAWVGHLFFERNRPATFRHPFYSLLGDWMMFSDIVAGRRKF